MLTDLKLAFDYYDKDNGYSGYISTTLFKNILHNFGFNKMTVRETTEELKRTDPDFTKRNCVDLAFCSHVIAHRWC